MPSHRSYTEAGGSESEKEAERERERGETTMTLPLRREEDTNQGYRWTLKAISLGKETDSALEPPKGMPSCLHLDSQLQEKDFILFKLLSQWLFVTAARGHEYRYAQWEMVRRQL